MITSVIICCEQIFIEILPQIIPFFLPLLLACWLLAAGCWLALCSCSSLFLRCFVSFFLYSGNFQSIQQSTVYSLQSTVCSLQSTVYGLLSTVYSLQSTVYSLQSTVYRIPSKYTRMYGSVEAGGQLSPVSCLSKWVRESICLLYFVPPLPSADTHTRTHAHVTRNIIHTSQSQTRPGRFLSSSCEESGEGREVLHFPPFPSTTATMSLQNIDWA
jgi:hypothetical protein